MCFIISKLFKLLFGKKDIPLLMIGLDGSGKTTLLFQFKSGQVEATNPTFGFNVEVIEHKANKFLVYDVGGQDKIRSLWSHYYPTTRGLIFVVDSSDREKMKIAKKELNQLNWRFELRNVPILVLANKQDLSGAMTVSEVAEQLEIKKQGRVIHIQGTSAVTGDGLYEGLDWLTSKVVPNKNKQKKSLQNIV